MGVRREAIRTESRPSTAPPTAAPKAPLCPAERKLGGSSLHPATEGPLTRLVPEGKTSLDTAGRVIKTCECMGALSYLLFPPPTGYIILSGSAV